MSRRDLTSIYCLEFYRKQKNWKFCIPRKDTKSQKPKKYGKEKVLNVTYNIEDGDSQKPNDLHNMAFISSAPVEKTTSDTNISSSSTKRLSLEWQQPINIYPDSEAKDEPSKSKKPLSNDICKRLAALQQAADLCKEDINNNKNELREMDNWENWSQGYESYDLMHTEDAAQGAGYEMIVDGNSQMMSLCHQTDLLGDVVIGDWIDCSVDSEGEFMRGADAAPHSSEIDLSLSSISSNMSFKELSRLSTQQLGAAALHHSVALRRLFLESRLRQSLTKSTSVPIDYNLPSGFDNIIAGSHLQEMKTREGDWVHACNLLHSTTK